MSTESHDYAANEIEEALSHPVILFDGVCNLCNGYVNFVIDRDPESVFKFGSLQSEAGRAYLRKFGMPEDEIKTIVLVDGDRFFVRSSAVVRIAKHLPFPWKIAWLGVIVPAPLRDVFYDLVAKNRYRWFGQSDQCRVPTPELRERFI